MDYNQYINSPKWKHKRLSRLKVDKFQCRTCRSKESLEVHHVSYDHLGNEPLEDLITLCKECHEAITNVIRQRRYSTKQIKFNNHKEERKLKYVATDKSQVDWSKPADYAQRAASRPAESRGKGDEKNFWETL